MVGGDVLDLQQWVDWPMSMPLSSTSLRRLAWRVQQNGTCIQMWVPRILSHAGMCSAFGKWSFVSTDKINITRLHWPVTHRELQDSCILRVAHKLKYASIKCSSFTIKAQNSTSQMTIHKQFVNTYAQMLNDLLLKQVKNRKSEQAPQKKPKSTFFVQFLVFLYSVSSFLDSMISPL